MIGVSAGRNCLNLSRFPGHVYSRQITYLRQRLYIVSPSFQGQEVGGSIRASARRGASRRQALEDNDPLVRDQAPA